MPVSNSMMCFYSEKKGGIEGVEVDDTVGMIDMFDGTIGEEVTMYHGNCVVGCCKRTPTN